jgi:RP/EB family microtubule-associated protein
MMDGAYFTSRNELLTFFNTLLNLNLTKIEQTASGAVACQLTEYLFPGSIPMSKVNWAAKSSHEYVANYKLLQKAFTANKVQRYVDVDKLIRGKYQDNLEFCQWLKAFFDMQSHHASNREVYDAVAVRAKGKGGKTVPTNNRGGGSAPRAPSVRSSSNAISGRSVIAPVVGKARIGDTSSSSTAPTASTSPSRRVTSAARPTRERPAQKENHATNLPNTTAVSSCKPTTTTVATTSSSIDEPALSSAAEVKKYQEKIKQLKSIQTQLEAKYSELQVLSTELEMNIANVESERDFYFEKLRGIEIMLQVCKEKEKLGGNSGSVSEMKKVFDNIFKVMYAAMEDNVVVDDEGNVSSKAMQI